MEGVNIAMGNIEKIWGVVSNQMLAMQTNQATSKGEFTTVINTLHEHGNPALSKVEI